MDSGWNVLVAEVVQEKIEKLQKENERLRQENVQIILDNRGICNETSRLARLNVQYDQRAAEAEEDLAKEKYARADLQSRLNEMKIELNKVVTAARCANQADARLEQAHTDLHLALQTQEDLHLALQARDEVIQRLVGDLAEATRARKNQTEWVAHKEEHCLYLRNQCEDLQQQLQNSKDREGTFKEKMEIAERDLAGMSRIADEKRAALVAAEAQVNSQRREYEALLQNLNDDTYRHNNEASRMTQEIRVLQVENEVLNVRLAAKAREDEVMCDLLESLRRQLHGD